MFKAFGNKCLKCVHRHLKAKSSCHCLSAIWMENFIAASAQKRGKHVNAQKQKQSVICIGNAIQMPKNQKGQRVDVCDLLARSMETKLPPRQERAPSSECGQVTESPHSPHHLGAQGHGEMCNVWGSVSISHRVSEVFTQSIVLYCWTIKPTDWWVSL